MISFRSICVSGALGLMLASPLRAQTDAGAPAATPAATARTHHAARRRAPRPDAIVATHPGFEERADGSSTFYVHVSAPIQPESRAHGRHFELVLHRARVALRNDRRSLETRFFNTPVVRMRVRRSGHDDLVFVFDLRAEVVPSVHAESNEEGNVIYIEFPAGSYLTPEERRAIAPEVVPQEAAPSDDMQAAPPSGGSQTPPPAQAPPPAPLSPDLQQLDRERPPDLGGHH